MTLNYCSSCGERLVRISSKISSYKAVCLDCELTFKVLKLEGNEVITVKDSSASQMTEAAMKKS
ncbi:hypothetical protein CS063_01860 [Sporanaerobium hydrogeniformans]|uniref:Uncharacterized protein n=1 Tax=Sporanaerobium hydrogeniformans TaxID=3072179 RepID=A0AC61DHE7_9FIRM|nr:hypothetical protein [Sporanaerobium hydrogeniformans]PHV72245.1 hypothetical protein CS063_01860 [Sporanaerobium hydrogeniformans]